MNDITTILEERSKIIEKFFLDPFKKKDSIKNYGTITMKKGSASGGHRQGSIRIGYDSLVKIFGNPKRLLQRMKSR